jgi:transcriptional regulator with XRE-family HTH domain
MQIVISPAQSRAARALLDLRLDKVASQAGVSVNTLSRFERDDRGATSTDTVRKVLEVYRAMGVEFLEGDGVRRAQQAA